MARRSAQKLHVHRFGLAIPRLHGEGHLIPFLQGPPRRRSQSRWQGDARVFGGIRGEWEWIGRASILGINLRARFLGGGMRELRVREEVML